MPRHNAKTDKKKLELDPELQKRIDSQKALIAQQEQEISELDQPSTDLKSMENSAVPDYDRLASFKGLKLYENRVEQSGASYSIPIEGIDVDVSINGDVYTTTETKEGKSRPTLTRMAAGAALGGGLGAAVGMASQKKEPGTSKTVVHDEREGVISVEGNGLRLSSKFPLSRKEGAEKFSEKIWDAKSKYSEAKERVAREREEREQEIDELRAVVEKNEPLLDPAKQKLETLKKGLEDIIQSAPEDQQLIYKKIEAKKARKGMIPGLIIIALIIAAIVWGFAHADDKKNAIETIVGQSWAQASQTLKDNDVRIYTLHDLDGKFMVAPTDKTKNWTVKSVDAEDDSNPTIVLHLDIPSSIKGLSWEKAQEQLDAAGFNTSTTFNPDYRLLSDTSDTESFTGKYPQDWDVKEIDNSVNPATITLTHSRTAAQQKEEDAEKAKQDALASNADVSPKQQNSSGGSETLETIQRWYQSEASDICSVYASTLGARLNTNVSLELGKGVFDSVNGAYISCSFKTPITYDLTARFLVTYPNADNPQLFQTSASDLSSNKLFDENPIANGFDQALATFNQFKQQYPAGNFVDQYA